MRRKSILGVFVLLPFLACAGQEPVTDAADPADLVIVNGDVYTLTWGEPSPDGQPSEDAPYDDSGWQPDASGVAIKDGLIVYVGDSDGAREYVGDGTRVFDAAGRAVIPGLVDSHTHVMGLGELTERIDLIDVATEEEAVALVEERAKTTPKGEWILGRGWDEGAWADRYPTMALLSERVPDHPVVLDSLHGFAVWGNRLAFEKAGITKGTATPDGGDILRDAAGEPSGVLLNRAGPLLRAAVPAPTPEMEKRFLLAGLQQMARDGYVAVHEAGVGSEQMTALLDLQRSGELPIRVYAMLSARDEPLCREWLETGPDESGDDFLAVRSVKAYYDAALGSRGARLLEDYADRPGHRGTSGEEYGFDQALVADMMRVGFQVGIHAIGDAGNRETLDFLESVIAEHPEARAERHRIEHAQVIHPDDFARFAELGVIASMEPPHAVEDMAWAEERLGPERIRGAYAWRTLRQAGVSLTFNSDLAGSDHDIFYGLHAAVTRRGKDKQPTDGWYPEQSMTPEEALRGYTSWSAHAAQWEEQTGVIEAGRWADLTVLDLDPLRVGESDPGALLDGEVVATIVAGRVVYEQP